MDRVTGSEMATTAAAADVATEAVSNSTLIDLRGVAPAVDLRDDPYQPISAARVSRRWYLLTALTILNILDLVTTRAVLDLGGEELNPLMQSIVADPIAPVLVKTAGLMVVALILRACPPTSRVVDRGLLMATLFYGVVVSWNVINLGLL